MPRRSRAALEFAATYPTETGLKPDLSPPISLTTAPDRRAYRELVSRNPLVASRPNFQAILVNYLRLRARARSLSNSAPDQRQHDEVRVALAHIERFLGLPPH
jgi:hypothetical protein